VVPDIPYQADVVEMRLQYNCSSGGCKALAVLPGLRPTEINPGVSAPGQEHRTPCFPIKPRP